MLPAESSIHTLRMFAITVSNRVVYADTSKNEDTWYGALWHSRCRIRFNLKNIRRVVVRMALHILLPDVQSLERRAERELQSQRQRLERQMVPFRCPRFPQLSSFHARASRCGRVLSRQLPIPTTKHLTDFFERNRKSRIFLRIKRFCFPEHQKQDF